MIRAAQGMIGAHKQPLRRGRLWCQLERRACCPQCRAALAKDQGQLGGSGSPLRVIILLGQVRLQFVPGGPCFTECMLGLGQAESGWRVMGVRQEGLLEGISGCLGALVEQGELSFEHPRGGMEPENQGMCGQGGGKFLCGQIDPARLGIQAGEMIAGLNLPGGIFQGRERPQRLVGLIGLARLGERQGVWEQVLPSFGPAFGEFAQHVEGVCVRAGARQQELPQGGLVRGGGEGAAEDLLRLVKSALVDQQARQHACRNGVGFVARECVEQRGEVRGVVRGGEFQVGDGQFGDLVREVEEERDLIGFAAEMLEAQPPFELQAARAGTGHDGQREAAPL